ncbi:glycosyl transferase family 1 [Elizabethkingia sp. HvH-WGS333]|uniref:glycosyl transferase family 1 n=1 Tax=Elizabethkingia TaxID=308865 RepID=UPI000741710B|nr:MULTISPECIES: glycosyl transferase family 1 [Elizabethkingia]KUG12282.1 glycosyl transferase family 1 [Elizabethkingia miricola]MCL1658727.1 glycosyl transferase family 1 [Elizabethkingia miricola]MDX8568543.1 glycosyl transferase family 1 [Elizabethkingia sp. HX XZB]MDX8572040.1 glycosyl transferase family 1 [Elizabethkingia sp. HX QKY]OIK44440.1 glycosyl transferase family 1 [Elizabethkingia sp. HvH-WGS333]
MKQKKILIITYYWPPAGGPGVQRWLKFAKYLPENNWEPIIYTPENPSYPLLDESLVKDVPKNIQIIQNKIWEPYQLAEKLNKKNKKFKAGQFDVGKNQSWKSKLSIFVRGNFFIPDARKFWVNPSISFLKKYLEANPVDVIVTTGPPHSLHLIGKGLKKYFPAIKWIADFRDPWTEISYYKHLKLTSWADQKHRKLEKEVFQNADITLATSYGDAENFRKAGANSACITNGFDKEEFNKKSVKNSKFTLSYIGVLEQLRNPENLWKVLSDIVQEDSDFAQNFELRFVGRVDDIILENLQSSPLKDNLNLIGYIPHEQSVKEMENADMLLITNFPKQESAGIIPGKIFEYLATQNPILSVGPEKADVEKILNETKAGDHFTYQDHEAIRSFVLQNYNNWKNNTVDQNSENLMQFSRRNLTANLASLLNSIV